MVGAWPAWPKLRVAQQEAPEESNIEDEGDDQPQVIYKLVQFYFTFNDFYLIKITNSNFAGCEALSYLYPPRATRTGLL
jgi:hypothetical protein